MRPLKLSRFRSAAAFRDRIAALGIELAFDEACVSGPEAPLASPLDTPVGRVRNRFAILPMEGWDGTPEGAPSELVRRRWERFGSGGAALIWGGEAVAVRADGRANPRQLVIDADTTGPLDALRRALVRAHESAHGTTDGLRVGLQLTHSGRYSRPAGTPRPRIAYRHPLLDAHVGVTSDDAVLSDEELDELVEDFVVAGVRAAEAGFDFVDVKHCHGYLLHELLSARERPGEYGGDLAGRMRFLERVLQGLAARASGLGRAVRLSAYDFAPFRSGADGRGEPEPLAGPRAFGGDGSGTGIDLEETHAFLERLVALGVRMVCVTCGSPYYTPHIQRPAFFPPSDGYGLPEDPLVGVARLVNATAELKRRHPDLVVVGSGYSYLQEWLPHVAQRQVRDSAVDLVGLGRTALTYPDLPADVLAGKPLERRTLCRTFSDCTTAPRHGLVSGCYPLDPFYRESPEADELARAKVKSS